MRIISVDPGFGRMGIAVIEQEQGFPRPNILYSSCVTTSPKEAFEKRLFIIGEAVRNSIAKHKPSVFAIERLFFSNNQRTALSVAEARGVIVYEAARGRLPLFEYTPLQIKTAVAGFGGASKEQVMFMVGNLAHFSGEKKIIRGTKVSDDEFDAIAIGLTHLAYSKPFLKNQKTNC